MPQGGIADRIPEDILQFVVQPLVRVWALVQIRVRYDIAGAPDEKPLCVIAVMHGHRSPRVMAAILRGREKR